MSKEVEIITIDGPSGAGKGTLSRLLGQSLGYTIVDSGAIYRLAALYVLDHKLDISNEALLYEKLSKLNIKFEVKKNYIKKYLDKVDVTERVREEHTGMMASNIAKLKVVRDALMQCQQNFAQGTKGLIADGRDMGSIVFPRAQHKIFLEANSKVRAKRRYDELVAKGKNPDYEKTLHQIEARDAQDRNRTIAPLQPAKDAVIIDTSSLNMNEVFAIVCDKIKLANNYKIISCSMSRYYELLIKAIDQLGYVPEFLTSPQQVDQANTRLLCQTRSIFYLLTYAKYMNKEQAKIYAYKLYQMIKSDYFNTQEKVWIKSKQTGNDNDPYEYAFVLFALSSLYSYFKEDKIKHDIDHVNFLIKKKFMSKYFEQLKDVDGVIGQNALMHLFEAYLNAYRYTKDVMFKIQAEDLYKSIIKLFFNSDKGLICEYSHTNKAKIFEPGHSFEWGCLILEAQRLGVDVTAMANHVALYQSARKLGISNYGLVKKNLDGDDEKMKYRIWPMLEYMRYLAMSVHDKTLYIVFEKFSETFIGNNLLIEYVDNKGKCCFKEVKSTTGYHFINWWQHMM